MKKQKGFTLNCKSMIFIVRLFFFIEMRLQIKPTLTIRNNGLIMSTNQTLKKANPHIAEAVTSKQYSYLFIS